jgi:translation initiation factor IF-2
MNNGKVRIYELSKELNLENKDIKEICEQLNISVKSHSSTITADQAEIVRSIAVKYPPEKTANNVPQEQNISKNKDKRKQQILAIHHKPNSANHPSQGITSDSTNAPLLVSPPKLPIESNSSSVNSSQKEQPVSVRPQLKKPVKSQTEPKSNQGKENRASEAIPGSTVGSPRLVGPPPRPQLNKSTNKEVPVKSSPRAAIIEPKNGSQEAKVEQPRKTEKKQLPSLPKLQRPQRAKPATEIEGVDKDLLEEEPIAADIEDIEEGVGELDKEVRKIAKLKRPTPPRKAKKWEEEEEEIEENPAKAKLKGKRRPKPIMEDDDELDPDLDIAPVSTAVSISTARPPKPQSLEQPTAANIANKKPKKPTPKAEKVPKAERRSNRKVVATLPETVILSSNLTVRELSERLNTPETDIIKNLFFKGIPVNITQTLDLETARLVAEELGVTVETPETKSAATKDTEMLDVADLENLQLRPPVVTIMGHVDHGKTTLLDSIRKSKVAQGEAGGITQHIGAYHVDIEHNGAKQQIVFLDTPGHEAFTAMRARGTRVTDIAVLVVAADDGVQPQTREAISHAKAAGVPIIVAINKVDKPEANPDRIKQELTEHELVAEDWGGDTIMVPVSALKGDNLDNLLEMIVLVSEIEELSANPDRAAKGTVIEANLDRTRGPVATLLVQNGTLRVGDSIVAGSVLGKIRAMIDDRGSKVEAATPSFAVEILGLNDVPEAGDEFEVYPNEKEARAVADRRSIEQRDSRLQQALSSRRISLSTISAQAQEGELKELNLILKADVQGSVEAIIGSLQQLPQKEVQIRILLAAPGEITETDVDLAAASGAVVVGFNTTLASGSRQAADREGVDVRQYNIIYKLLDDIQAAMEGLLDPEEVEESLGQAEVRAVFPVGRGSVAGCYVQSGKIVRNCQIRVNRNRQVVYEGNLDSLKRMKEDAKEVNAGYECGLGSSKFNDWQSGDIVEAYEMVFKRRTLATN